MRKPKCKWAHSPHSPGEKVSLTLALPFRSTAVHTQVTTYSRIGTAYHATDVALGVACCGMISLRLYRSDVRTAPSPSTDDRCGSVCFDALRSSAALAPYIPSSTPWHLASRRHPTSVHRLLLHLEPSNPCSRWSFSSTGSSGSLGSTSRMLISWSIADWTRSMLSSRLARCSTISEASG